MEITKVRHAWPNPPGFVMNRTNGHPDYTFVHFTTSVEFGMGGEKRAIPPHSCIIYAPSTPQHFYCENGMIHDWIHFKDVADGYFDKLNIPVDELFYIEKWHFITEIVQEIESEFLSNKSHGEIMINHKIEELFIRLSRVIGYEQEEAVSEELSEKLKRLRQEVFSNLDKQWNIPLMAKKMSISESHFFSLYRSYYGTSPLNDLIQAKIDSAKHLLQFTDRSISDIALLLGYNNITHFSRQFKSIVGVSPAQYRKER